MSQSVSAARFTSRSAAAPLALILAAALGLGGCAGSGLELPQLAGAASEDGATAPAAVTSSMPPPAIAAAATATAAASEEKLPAAVVRAREQRAAGDKPGAMKTLEAASAKAPGDKLIARERGLLALETGRVAEARRLLASADDAKSPDWRVKSALGAAHAASGDFESAHKAFQAALGLAPDHPSILNNMALAYALEGRHTQAEGLLRRAAAASVDGKRARQNLALILGLNGDLEEARKVSEAALPKPVAAANVSYLEKLRASGVKVSRARRDGEDRSLDETTVGALAGER